MTSHYKKDDDRPIPNPVRKFSQAFVHYPEILQAVSSQGFSDPSPIQCQSWPILLKGYDMIGIAQTGTGKTVFPKIILNQSFCLSLKYNC